MVLMWPGVLVMGATVSNASLELLAVACLVYALWRADSETSTRWLLLSGLALGLGVLTKFTVVALAPLLAVVAVRYLIRSAEPRKWWVLAATAAIPIVVLSPWLAFNLHHYDALTPNGLAKQIQMSTINPTGENFGFGTFWSGIPDLFSGFYPLEWIFRGPERPKVLVLMLEFVKAAVFGFPLLLFVLEPRWIKSRHALLLAGPLVLGIAMIAYSTVLENWPLTLPRYVFPALPPLALLAALSWSRLLRPPAAPLVLSALCSLTIAVVWIDSVGRYL
jgi:4-amino-4-deoxy-L-arabinose transferase-like glycosyltransferase